MRIHCRILLLPLIFVIPAHVSLSQSTFIPLNDDYYHLIERFELKTGKLSSRFHTGVKPFERKAVMEFLDEVEQDPVIELNDKDLASFRFMRWGNWEWTKDTLNLAGGDFQRKNEKGVQRRFWAHPADFYSHWSEDFDVHVNFVTDNFLGKDNNLNRAVYYSGRGVEVRGMINRKLGFYTYISDNQGHFPKYVQGYADRLGFPGEGLTKISERKNVDFFSARGYITFNPIKSINLQFGHDKNFIGNGYRSLFLSDNSAPYLFLKLNTRIGRFNYTNLWSSMINDQDPSHQHLLRRKKYAAMHHLSVNITDRLNVGFFEAEVFSRDSTGGGFDLNYLNPVIFYRFVESYLGSSDNALLGLDFKWLPPVKNTSVYGQVMIDEFLSRDLFNGKKSWTRKYAFQLGSKMIDALNIPNLDLQLEYNVVYPYTYSHRDGGRNYMHYKQPLAHPLEANFHEFLGIARYQLNERFTLFGTMMFANKGIDIYGRNYGGDLTLDYDTRYSDNGVRVGQGLKQKTNLFDIRLSYMLRQNLFIDYRMMNRWIVSRNADLPKTGLFSFGVRYNMAYRQQIF